jgi:integrase/recombinase XerD
MRFLDPFAALRFGAAPGDLNTITPDAIVAFLHKLKAGSRPRRYKALPSNLCCLFNFLFWSGETKRKLADSLQRVATSAAHLPRYLAGRDPATDRGVRSKLPSAATPPAPGRR